MIETLHISNYALIDNIDIEFAPGLNIITGETGAGKSIMMGALSLLLGARADMKAVRVPQRKSVIEAVFGVSEYPGLRAYCLDNDLEWDDEHCILRREISPSGRSRAFVNDSPVPLARLQGLAMLLVDIHSQNENQLLSRPEFQMQLLDTLAGNAPRLEVFARRYQALRDAMHRLRAAKAEIARTTADEEFTRYQLQRIEDVNPVAGELDELERDREILSGATDLKQAIGDALDRLAYGQHNVLEMVSEASGDIMRLDEIVNPDDDLPGRLEMVSTEVKDIVSTLARLDTALQADPRQLEATEERIARINELLVKHRLDTVDQLIDLRDDLRRRLATLDDSDGMIADLEREARRAYVLARETAREISAERKEQAAAFAALLKEKAAPLGMSNLRCDIRVEQGDMTATGIDRVQFMFAFNKNQQLMPVGQTASGGEISRLMLTIKGIVASRMHLPSIIFDEVDTGVSGDVANRMGDMMCDISRSIQVIAITHLPQVAAKGAIHFKVFKRDDDDATHTHIESLDSDRRRAELALMLSGDPADPSALVTADALLARNGAQR